MLRSSDPQVRRFVHDSHLRHFSRFHSPQLLSETFAASVNGTVADYRAALRLPTLVIAAVAVVVFAIFTNIWTDRLWYASFQFESVFTTMLLTRIGLFVAFGLIMAALVIVSGYTSINAVVKAELFPAHIRALGVALPYAIANTVFGGTAEYVALWLKQYQMEQVFYWYVTAMIAVSLVVYVRMRDTRRASLILED